MPNLLPFVVFLQNAAHGGARYQHWFPVSWSLCVEEWFYLLLAAALLFLPAVVKVSPRAWVAGLLGLALAMPLARLAVFLSSDGGTLSFDDGYRTVLLLRADAFVYGGAIYLWQRRADRRPVSRQAWRNRAAGLAGLLIIAISWIMRRDDPNGLWTKVLVPSSVPLGAALLLPWCATLSIAAGSLAGRAATFLSTRTYAIYLSHLPVQYLLFSLVAPSAASFGLYLAAMLAVAHLVHVHIERPLMALRPHSARQPGPVVFAPAARPAAPGP